MGFRARHRIPDLGVGVGFRVPHYADVLESRPAMDWFEVISENFMGPGGRPLANLRRLLEGYTVVLHGVSLSIGASNPLDEAYLHRLKWLIDIVKPPWVSDHLCWGGTAALHAHELLPLPQNMETVHHVVERVKRVTDFLEVPFALENVSSYMAFRESTMPEWAFVGEVAERADSGILLDVNNIYVSSRNHDIDPASYIDGVPHDRVAQIHVAGHTEKGAYVLDTHADFVRDEVWALYEHAIRRTGAVSTLVEWDEDIPEWGVLADEARKAQDVRRRALGAPAPPVTKDEAAWSPG